jgi:hypothetical protein
MKWLWSVVRMTVMIWSEIAFGVFMLVTWPFRTIADLARRGRWGDPR